MTNYVDAQHKRWVQATAKTKRRIVVDKRLRNTEIKTQHNKDEKLDLSLRKVSCVKACRPSKKILFFVENNKKLD